MPHIDILTLQPPPERKFLSEMAHAVAGCVGCPAESVGVTWQRLELAQTFNMERTVARLFCRAGYTDESVRAALRELRKILLRLSDADNPDVLVICQRVLPSHIMSSRGLWMGGDEFLR